MVHALRSTSSAGRPTQHPDARRIAGLAVAILVNTAFLMLLLVPLRVPPAPSLPGTDPVVSWIIPKPVTPPKPTPVPAAPQHPHPSHPQPVVQAPHPEALPDNPPIVLAQGDPMATNPTAGDFGPSTPAHDTGPVPGVRLEYADAPAPAYPRDALRDGAQGTVLLQVLVDVDGRPLRVDIQRSSGDRRLDLAARQQILQHWRFRPAMRDGQPVQAIGLVPVAFNLDG